MVVITIDHSRKEWMPECVRLMVVHKELSTIEIAWSFQQETFLTNSTRALERNGTN
jgi:hypothetical protein